MGIVSLLFSQFGVFLNSKLERKKFYIDDKWTIELPPDWEKTFLEIELDNSPIFETIFFQPGSDLGIGVYYLNFLKDDNYRIVEADIQEVATVFEEIMDKIEDKKEYKIQNYKSSKIKSYEYTFYKNGRKFYAIKTGVFMKGCLLRVNIVSTIKKEVEKAMYYLFSIKEADPKEVEFFKKVNSYKE